MARKVYKPLREKETLKIFWRVIWQRHRNLFFGSLVYLIGVIGITILVPLFISQTLASIIINHGELGNNLTLLITVAAVGVVGNLVGFLCILRLNAHVNADATDMSLETLLKRSVGFHTNNIGGKLVNNAVEYGGAFSKLIDVLCVNLVPFVLTLIIGISVVMYRSTLMGLALLGVTAVTVALILAESYRRSSLRVERKRTQDDSIANLSDTIVNAQAVKTFAREKDELQTHYKLNHRLRDLRLKDWTGTGISGSIRMAVLLGLQIIFIAFVAQLIKEDPSVLGVGIFSFAYTLALLNKLFDVGTMLRNLEEAFLSASTMTGIIQEEVEIKDKPHAKVLKVEEAVVNIKDVSFSYKDDHANENVFTQLSLHIPAGQKIGLVGPSGGGKSTLTRLLLRFDDVTDGVITIDSQDVRSVTQESLRQAISYVPQEPLLFHRSILANIAYGKPGATLQEVRKAAKLAFADDFIEKLPQKYDTIVGERGVKLSGGQRQRVAIARAILKDAPLLVLDEATSALDSESEVYIQKALAELMKARTTIVIAHRLSTIQKMDRIIVLADGTIIENDTHANLLKKKGMYAKLWAHQSGGFITEG